MEIKLTTKNMAYMAMFAAMQVVLEYCTKFYEMPKGGNCAFSLVAIILCGYLMNLGLATFYGPLSVIFDYLLPMVLIGLTPLIPLLKVGKYELPVGIIVMGGLKTICHLISGWYAFQTPLQANLTYNLPYNIATIIACFILFVILYTRLKKAVHL